MRSIAAAVVIGLAAAAAYGSEPLQTRIDAAPAGSVVFVERGTYHGDLTISRPLTIIGRGRPLLVGSGKGTVVSIHADNVTFDGFDIDGLGGGDLGQDASGIHVAAKNVSIRNCAVRRTLFGIYLREADGIVVDGCEIRGIAGKAAGEKGSGIHVFDTHGFRLHNNDIADVRDGLYIQSSDHGRIIGNRARNLRYGLHYMYSDDNVFDENTFENGAAGAAVMYSRRIAFRRNRFLHNRGFASVGLLLKTCDDVVAEDNLIADNARGIFVEGSERNVFRRNIIAESDTAIVLYDSASANRFEGNSFVANLTPLMLVGRRTDTKFEGNYWSGNREPDLDGDGVSDRPYRLSTVFDHLRGNITAADLMAQGIAAKAIGAAEEAFPVLDEIRAVDPRPLARPPALPQVPRAGNRSRRNHRGITASVGLLAAGVTVLMAGRRRKSR